MIRQDVKQEKSDGPQHVATMRPTMSPVITNTIQYNAEENSQTLVPAGKDASLCSLCVSQIRIDIIVYIVATEAWCGSI